MPDGSKLDMADTHSIYMYNELENSFQHVAFFTKEKVYYVNYDLLDHVSQYLDQEVLEKLYWTNTSNCFEHLEDVPGINQPETRIENSDEEAYSSRFEYAFYQTLIKNKEYIIIDVDRKEVIRFYKRNNDYYHTPDFGTFTGDLETGIDVSFEYFKDPVVFKYKNDKKDEILWVYQDGTHSMGAYKQISLDSIRYYIEQFE